MASLAPGTLIVAGALLVAACGSGASSGTPSVPLSADALAGKQFAQANCMGCHTTNGSSATGPTWSHLAGSTVKLSNSTSVVADDAYLTRAIEQPDADIVSGFPKAIMSAAFPPKSISDSQAKQLVAYIDALR